MRACAFVWLKSNTEQVHEVVRLSEGEHQAAVHHSFLSQILQQEFASTLRLYV